MATTLKTTPAIKGNASRRFNAAISESRANKIPQARRQDMLDLVRRVMAKAKGC